ncbi:ABC transporter permease [Enterococcus asini]|uniref:ABC transporter permease n=1 Tax=Enterococcus asini TaxID=57732 RepID=UPI001E5A259C|nr:ABC transporter permease [Enterococcus asini]MCD5027824.1 ABC transporter permease [Enterococcus asini]
MKELFATRLKQHQKQMMRYLRYVFNDHFVLACTFLLGGVGLYYSDFVKTLPANFLPGKLVILIVLVGLLHVGTFVSLTKPADQVFLLPKEVQMQDFLNRAFRYSLWFPFAVLVLGAGFLMPLYVVSTQQSYWAFFPLVLLLWSLKVAFLYLRRYQLVQNPWLASRCYPLWLVTSGAMLAVALWFSPWLGLIGSLLLALVYRELLLKRVKQPLAWDKMIATENRRLQRIYRFINLFTDVPQIATSVKRRKYLDGILALIPKDQGHSYLYLFSHRLLRGSDFGGLYARLLVLGSLLLYFVAERWFSIGLGCLFLYLIGFQLAPLYNQFQYMVMTQLYPLPEKQKARALQQLIVGLLLFAGLVFTLVSCFVYPDWVERAWLLGSFSLFSLIFGYLYLPRRLKKMQG